MRRLVPLLVLAAALVLPASGSAATGKDSIKGTANGGPGRDSAKQ
ncbi:MAG TPA: hypothetical protein VKB23_09285 [Solirubrobacterales bacterium]|nr:hypothetical protein [Solirubrobacterales bacterium]